MELFILLSCSGNFRFAEWSVDKQRVTHFSMFPLHVGHKHLSGIEEAATFRARVPWTWSILVLRANFLELLLSVFMTTVVGSVFLMGAV